MSIGIPYAHAIINEQLELVRVCPVCKEHFPETTDELGEALDNLYGEHYEQEHSDEPPSTFGVSKRKLRPVKDPIAAQDEADAFWGVES